MILDHEKYIRYALDLAKQELKGGGAPFTAVLVSPSDEIITTAVNTIPATGNYTNHAETLLCREVSGNYQQDYLEKCTIYSLTEPCAMCTGSIYFTGIGNVVYGVRTERYQQVAREFAGLSIRPEDILSTGMRQTTVEGPFLEDEAYEVQEQYWKKLWEWLDELHCRV